MTALGGKACEWIWGGSWAVLFLLYFILLFLKWTKERWLSYIFYLFKFQSAVSGEVSLLYIEFWVFFGRDESKGIRKMWVDFFNGNRQESGVECFCPGFLIDDNWSCFLEFIGSNYDQISFCGIHIPFHFPTTHPPIQPLHLHGRHFFFSKDNRTE